MHKAAILSRVTLENLDDGYVVILWIDGQSYAVRQYDAHELEAGRQWALDLALHLGIRFTPKFKQPQEPAQRELFQG